MNSEKKETNSRNLNQAIDFIRQGRFERAEEYLYRALEDNFDDSVALYYLGIILIRRKNLAFAAQVFMRSLDINPNGFESWVNLGNCFKAFNKDDEAKFCWQKASEIPGKDNIAYADVYCNYSSLHVNSGTAEEGIQFCDKALELHPEHYDAMWNKALLMLELGNYAEGWDLYNAGFKNKNRLYRNYGDNIEDWCGEEGKTVIVWGEQGIGDEILFSSMIPDLIKKSKKVIFDCHPRLVEIFKTSFPEIEAFGTRKDEYIEWPLKFPEANAKVATGDLGRFFRRDIKDFNGEPYLKAPKDRVEYYKQKLAKLGRKPKIGISWTGGYLKTRKDYRTIDLEKWKPILTQTADFISLQYTPDAYKAVADIEEKLDIKIHHWPNALESFNYAETAALVSNLDLVITINTSIHHLAGALGIETWTMTPKAKAWRYYSPDGKTIPWYKSVTQYEQNQLNNWDEILRKVSNKLKEFIRNHTNKKIEEYKNTELQKPSIRKRKCESTLSQ